MFPEVYDDCVACMACQVPEALHSFVHVTVICTSLLSIETHKGFPESTCIFMSLSSVE